MSPMKRSDGLAPAYGREADIVSCRAGSALSDASYRGVDVERLEPLTGRLRVP